MGSTGNGASGAPKFFLTPQQQKMLFDTLSSTKPHNDILAEDVASKLSDPFHRSPIQNADPSGFQDSTYLDNYGTDFSDSSFGFFAGNDQPDQLRMMADIAGSTRSDSLDNDGTDKRSHPGDDDDGGSPEKEPKRRESSEKIPKKPGRKPLTSEPSSKRKAQNRAAQRAFRERKEKHLKDLETKVEELEKTSRAANSENNMLRTQIEQMSMELKQYKQRVSLMSERSTLYSHEKQAFGMAALNNLRDVNFQFEFPKFGVLPGPPAHKPQRSLSQSAVTEDSPQSLSNENFQMNGKEPGLRNTNAATQVQNGWKSDASRSRKFTPSGSSSAPNGSTASIDSTNMSNFVGNTASPSASSYSNFGPSSSCGTSPERLTQSPMDSKPVDTLTTIGEEQSVLPTYNQQFAHFPNVDVNNANFDWLAQTNGTQFDPQLFGDYREPQENILANPTFDDLFSDSLGADFFTPYNAPPESSMPKLNLIDEIDAKKDSIENPVDESTAQSKNLDCSKVWGKLQSCTKAQQSDFDLDGLCSELMKKAKCSGKGPVVGDADFEKVLKKHLAKTGDCKSSSS